jgi:predicted transcriptional regulator
MTAATDASALVNPAMRPAITELFHRISRVLPQDQEILELAPQTKAFEAIAMLKVRNYSQAPVVESGTVVGIFSFRSFSVELASQSPDKMKAASLLVEECMEAVGPDQFRSVTGEFRPLLGLLDGQDAVLIGEPERLQGILTAMDVLRYLYGIASPFVLLTEIELGVRGLMRHCADDASLVACAQNSLKDAYKNGAIPARPEDMHFSDYVSIIGDGRNWPRFADAFGGTRDRTRAKLDEIRELRNDVFHFKRELEPNDHAALRLHREWILVRCRLVEARKGKEATHV